MNFPRSQGSRQWQGQDFSLCVLTPCMVSFPLYCSCLLIQDVAEPRVSPTEQAPRSVLLWPQGTLISRIHTGVWTEQGLRGGTVQG